MDRGLTPRQPFLRALTRPTKLLILSPIGLLLFILCAFVFGLLFMLFTTFPTVFEEQYHFSAGISGLSYLGVGIGMAVSLRVFAAVSDKLQAFFPLSEALTVCWRSHSWQEVSPRGGFFLPQPITTSLTFGQYESVWEDPSATSIAWVDLMFSMLYNAAQLQDFTIDFPDGRAESPKAGYHTMKDAFQEMAVQCHILARYTTGGQCILETLIMISMTLHLAMRMGYYRDPDHFPGISPFGGEMRRRIWTIILQLDLVLSLEMGLPRSAIDTQMDTKQPHNLRDCDFEEETTEMPPPRPETEWTPVLPLFSRGRLVTTLGLICDVNADINPPSYGEYEAHGHV